MIKEKGLVYVGLLFSLVIVLVVFFSSDSAAEGYMDMVNQLISGLKPGPQQCSGGGVIYIHPANASWDSIAAKACAVEQRGEKVACNERRCDQEGEYLYTFHVDGTDGKHSVVQGGLFGGVSGLSELLASSASDLAKKGDVLDWIAPAWSPVNYDEQEWACTECGGGSKLAIWDATANGGKGICCGDDPVGRNPNGDPSLNIDDPDMGETACQGNGDSGQCPVGLFGDNQGVRHFKRGASITGSDCCGDDAEDCALLGGPGYICIDIFGTSYGSTGSSYDSDSAEGYEDSAADEGTCPDPDDCDEGSVGATSSRKWYWRNAGQKGYAGIIIDSECNSKRSFLSDGSSWIGCMTNDLAYSGQRFGIDIPNPLNPTGQLSHGYACTVEDNGDEIKYKIAECCGSEDCKQNYRNINGEQRDWGGIEKTSGESIYLGGKLIFCRNDFKWSDSLNCDNSGTDCTSTCEGAKYPNGSVVPARWTGKGCCSKISTSPKYFNDVGGMGACYNGSFAQNEFLFEEDPGLIAFNGSLLGCNLSGSEKSTYSKVKDELTQTSLIHDMSYCSITGKGYYYCDVDSVWKQTNGKNMTHLTYMPREWQNGSNSDFGCCEPNSCWSGSSCYENQVGNPIAEPYKLNNTQYRCVNGAWDNTPRKRGLDGNFGYCPSNDMCLVSISGKTNENSKPEANPVCISDGQYIQDSYCDKGNWSSRTKQIALTLLSLSNVDGDYTLYCGPYSEVANYFDYSTFALKAHVKSSFENKKFNKLCILHYNGNSIIGLSLNTNLTDKSIDIPGLFSGFKACPEKDTDKYESCKKTTSDKAWFNGNLKSLITSNTPIRLNPNPSFGQVFESLIRAPVRTFLGFIKEEVSPDIVAYDFANDLVFDQIFIKKKGKFRLMSAYHDGQIVAKYDGADSNLCRYISLYNSTFNRNNDFASNILCLDDPDSKSHRIYATGSDLTNINPARIWPDLSGKLRFQ